MIPFILTTDEKFHVKKKVTSLQIYLRKHLLSILSLVEHMHMEDPYPHKLLNYRLIQCSMTGVSKIMVCANRSVEWCI